MNIQPLSSTEDILAAQKTNELASRAAAQNATTAAAEGTATPAPAGMSEPVAASPAAVNGVTQPVTPQTVYSAPASEVHDATPYIAGTAPVQQSTPKLSVGVYVIVALLLIGAASAIAVGIPHAPLQAITGLIDGLIAFGLLTLSNLARRLIVIVGLLICVGTALNAYMLSAVQHRVHLDQQALHAAVAHDAVMSHRSPSPTLQNRLDDTDAKVQMIDEAYPKLYMQFGFQFVATLIAVVYLSRSKIKDEFV